MQVCYLVLHKAKDQLIGKYFFLITELLITIVHIIVTTDFKTTNMFQVSV